MFDGSTPGTPSLLPALRASGFIGAWETNVAAGHSILDVGAATLMAGDPALAGCPLNLEAALGCVHPDDRGWVFDRIRRTRRTGGGFAAEFRTLAADGTIRWVLNRGYLADTGSGIHGYGAYIDTTDAHDAAKVVSLAERRRLPQREALESAAEHAIAARMAIDRSGLPRLRLLVDMLLWEMGRTLARRHGN